MKNRFFEKFRVELFFLIGIFGAISLGANASPKSFAENSIIFLPVVSKSVDYVIYYVSPTGDNADGRSWETAWNELDQIQWDLIKPGDFVYIDGGASSEIYETSLKPLASGTAEKPITIQLAPDTGRNGQAVLFGGNSIPLPECGQLAWDESQLNDALPWAIQIEVGMEHIVVDGTKRSGFKVHGWRENGVRFFADNLDNGVDDNPSNITLRYIEMFNNGEIERKHDGATLDLYFPFHGRPGISLAGTNHTLDYLEIHDNAGDAIQSGFTNPTGGTFNNLDDITITNSWFYNSRPHSGVDNSPPGETCNLNDFSGCDELGAPQMARDYQFYPTFPSNRQESFNWCTHSDGIQLFSSNDLNNLTIKRTIIGPNFMNGLILGDNAGPNESAWVNNLQLEDVVITRYMHNAIGMNNKDGKSGSSWGLNHVTMYGHYNNLHKGSLHLDLVSNEGGHRITNSYKIHGQTNFETEEIVLENNCDYAMYRGGLGGLNTDPKFRRLANGDLFEPDLAVDFATIFKDNYFPTNSTCQAMGSRITTISDIFPRGE